jgi:hypothetical protein
MMCFLRIFLRENSASEMAAPDRMGGSLLFAGAELYKYNESLVGMQMAQKSYVGKGAHIGFKNKFLSGSISFTGIIKNYFIKIN